MRLVFVDETGDKDQKDYLGLCVASIDSRSYPKLKRTAHKILRGKKWEESVEFKGHYLFSEKKGCSAVPVEDRVAIARELLDLNVAKDNVRMKFAFGALRSDNHGRDYVKYLPGLLDAVLTKAADGAGKDLIAVTCDERSDVDPETLHAAIDPVLTKKGYVVFEHVVWAKSSFHTPGLMFADLVGYLQARTETLKPETDAGLFDELDEDELRRKPKLRKLLASRDLLSRIKKLDIYRART